MTVGAQTEENQIETRRLTFPQGEEAAKGVLVLRGGCLRVGDLGGQDALGEVQDGQGVGDSFLVVAEAARRGERTLVAASTGNAASSLAAVCAAAGRRAVIFVPQSAPRAKLVQMLICGARVVPVRGSFDDALRLSLE